MREHGSNSSSLFDSPANSPASSPSNDADDPLPSRSLRTALLGTIATLALALLVGTGLAQQRATASHDVTVHIPSVLRLSLGAGESGDATARQRIRATVRGGDATLSPARTRLRVFSNDDWQILAHFSSSADDLGLSANGVPLGDVDALLSEGGPTGGWRSLDVAYALTSFPAADGVYGGTVTYTLTRP